MNPKIVNVVLLVICIPGTLVFLLKWGSELLLY